MRDVAQNRPAKIKPAKAERWNVFTGCSPLSDGCGFCIAPAMVAQGFNLDRTRARAARYGQTLVVARGRAAWSGAIVQASEKTRFAPLSWKNPRDVELCALSDFFHPGAPDAWRVEALAIAALTPRHGYSIATRRAREMRDFLSAPATQKAVWTRAAEIAIARGLCFERIERIAPGAWPLPNVALGVSIENQAAAARALPALIATPAHRRFILAAPLLGAIDLSLPENFSALAWLSCAGETGPGARPAHPEWARSLRDQCAAFDLPFRFDGWGEWAPLSQLPPGEAERFFDLEARVGAPDDFDRKRLLSADGAAFPTASAVAAAEARSIMVLRVGAASAGAQLDGIEYRPAQGQAISERR
jgi:protein gp37